MSDASRLAWRKSSHCSHDTCVEVARLGTQILLRDSKEQDGPMLAFRQAEWADFVEGVRRGEFDLPIEQA
jgi:hypothetical protein